MRRVCLGVLVSISMFSFLFRYFNIAFAWYFFLSCPNDRNHVAFIMTSSSEDVSYNDTRLRIKDTSYPKEVESKSFPCTHPSFPYATDKLVWFAHVIITWMEFELNSSMLDSRMISSVIGLCYARFIICYAITEFSDFCKFKYNLY